MKINALALLAISLLFSSCARIKAGIEYANRPPVYGAYGPFDIYKSPLSSPYVAGYSSYGTHQPLCLR